MFTPLLAIIAFVGAPMNRALPLVVDDNIIATGALVAKNLVLTSAHAVHSPLQAFGCGTTLTAGILVKIDMENDLALFTLKERCDQVIVSKLATTEAEEGTWLSIQGYPGQVRRTTSGIAASYEVIGIDHPQRLLVMDLVVAGGNSGGPVLDAKGLLTGIVLGKACYQPNHTSCYGLAVPLKTIKAFLEGISL
jgi:S1-C subfamily serine protease